MAAGDHGREVVVAGESVDPIELNARLAEELRFAEARAEMLTTLLRGLAHDLNNRCSGIEGYAQLIQANDVDVVGCARAISDHVARARDILRPISAFAGFPRNFRAYRTDLAGAIREIAEAREDGRRWHLEILDHPLVAMTDADARPLIDALMHRLEEVTEPSSSCSLKLAAHPRHPHSSPHFVHARVRLSGRAREGVDLWPFRARERTAGSARPLRVHLDWQLADGQAVIDCWMPALSMSIPAA